MKEVLVLGLGNILWADEGFGVRAVEAFHAAYRDRNDVDVMDGGTLGSYLMNAVMDAKRLLILDCCDLKEEPGTLRVLRDDDIRVWSSTKISAHQTGMNDVLAKAMLLGYEPEAITVIGVEPWSLAADELRRWGFPVQKREKGETVTDLGAGAVEQDVYESGRPSEEQAPRSGDVRFMPAKE